MSRICLVAALFFGAITPAGGGAQDMDGYRLAGGTPLPELLFEERSGGRFVISITRRSALEGDAELIGHAESLYPSPALLSSAVDHFIRQQPSLSNSSARFESAGAGRADRWWWHDWEGTLLPFALTGEAVQHYIERLRSLSETAATGVARGTRPAGRFEYTAVVVRDATGSGERTVTLAARWSYHCGRGCGTLSFTHGRTVVFDREGNVVSISGDQAPEYLVG